MRPLSDKTRKQREDFFKRFNNLEKYIEKGRRKKVLYPSIILAVILIAAIIIFFDILPEEHIIKKMFLYLFILMLFFILFEGVIFAPYYNKKIKERRRLLINRKDIFSDMLKIAKERLKILEEKNLPGVTDCKRRVENLKRTQNPQLC